MNFSDCDQDASATVCGKLFKSHHLEEGEVVSFRRWEGSLPYRNQFAKQESGDLVLLCSSRDTYHTSIIHYASNTM